MTGQEDVWDAFYRSNGRAWRGNCRMPDPFGGMGDALDIGCGSGKSTSSLIDMGYDVTGVDFSAEAVSICRDRFDARFEQGSVLALPFPDGSFDYITLIHVLEHVPDGDMPSAAYEVRRVLRTGGHVFIRDFAPGDLRSGSREGSDIDYFHRGPDAIAGFFDGLSVVSSELVEERTRFGAVRRRSEVLLRLDP